MGLLDAIKRRLAKAQPGTGPAGEAGAQTSGYAEGVPALLISPETPMHPLATLPQPDSRDRYRSLIDPLTPAPTALEPAEAAAIRGYLDAAQAEATREAYRSDLAEFGAWCEARNLPSLPATPQTVARYLVDRAQTFKVSTLTRRLSAIAQAHQARGHDTPTASILVRKVFAGIRRKHGAAPAGKTPILPDDLKLMVGHLGDDASDLRDRAILLVGFAGALRRSEIVGLNVGDLVTRREGMILTLRRSKTDQEGAGVLKGIPRGRDKALCPVRAVEAWIKAAQIAEGPLFRPVDRFGRVSPDRLADYTVVRVVKRLVEAIGLEPAEYGGHSLRAGLATAAAAAGKAERDIMRQTGHKSTAMVRRYIRIGELFADNAADGLL